jgi:hypothetical protein
MKQLAPWCVFLEFEEVSKVSEFILPLRLRKNSAKTPDLRKFGLLVAPACMRIACWPPGGQNLRNTGKHRKFPAFANFEEY